MLVTHFSWIFKKLLENLQNVLLKKFNKRNFRYSLMSMTLHVLITKHSTRSMEMNHN